MRSEAEVNRAIDQYADMVRRVCFTYMKNFADTEDIFQTVFLKYVLSCVEFESEAHEKAWILRVTINACKDVLKSFFRTKQVSLDEMIDYPAAEIEPHSDVLEAVLRLPAKYKDVVYLHYYEGYTAKEIAGIIGGSERAVTKRIGRAREKLKFLLEEE